MNKIDLIDDYLSGMCIKSIMDKHSIQRHVLYKNLNEWNVDKSARPRIGRNKVSDERKRIAISMYESGEKPRDIAKAMKMGGNVIYKILREHGHDNFATYPLNENCFSDINEKSSYFAGLLLADGCVTKTQGGKANIYLDSLDRDILEKYTDFIESDRRRIHSRKRDGLFRVSVSNERMAQDLERFGIIPRKSRRAEIPDRVVLDRHYWRGFIDGDGWYVWNNRNTAQVGIGSAAIGIIKGFIKFIDSYGLYKKNKIYERKDTLNPFYSYVLRGPEAFDLIDILYFDSSVWMDRKYEKAMEFIYNRNKW